MHKNRVFSFADRNCPAQLTGGPGGVNLRLYTANKRLHYFEHLILVFHDKVLEQELEMKIQFHEKIYEGDRYLHRYFMKLNEYYSFAKDDVFIFHDASSADVFNRIFSLPNTIIVYHQQGSLYKEWSCFTGSENLEIKKKCDNLMKRAFASVKYVAFPSYGAIESVIDSDDSMKELIESVEKKVLYNGCNCEQYILKVGEIAQNIIDNINSNEIPTFITVATLNEAKGVERIPQYLEKIKEKYGEFLWVVIGNGVKSTELCENVQKYHIKENTLWVKERIPHNDLLAIYQYTDFYILAHRFSIFDFATIEAMHYGNIPILTPVGGNKEIICEQNGIFINDLASTEEFDYFMEHEDVNAAREKNVKISEEKFSEEAFLKGYHELVEQLL
jgi:glycosyltransferase involved in cell wall biosynthesis